MRSGDALRRDTLRMAESAAYNGEKRRPPRITDDEVAAVLDARGQDAARIDRGVPKGAREDLAAKEEAEIAILGRVPAGAAVRGRDLRRSSPRPSPPPGATSARTWARSWAGCPRRRAAAPMASDVSELVGQALAGRRPRRARHAGPTDSSR